MKTKTVLIVAGEPSGDLHAANLVRDIKTLNPDIKFFGIAGTLSQKRGVEIVFDISNLALVGLTEVIKNIFTVKSAYSKILSKIDSEKPDLAILVDYPGFNLRLAKELHKRSIPVAYYISPQVWAWGRDRIKIIKKCVKRVLVFFKFEEELYKTYDVDAEFVGHPLLDVVKITSTKNETCSKYGIDKDARLIALLPGSRELEVKALLPIMTEAARIIKSKIQNAQFIILKHPDLPDNLYRNIIKDHALDIKMAEGDVYNVVGASSFAMVASGTTTLETALIGTPFLITYKASLITYLLYKIVADIKFIGLVNIIAGHRIVPELLQFDATPQNLSGKAIGLITDKESRKTMLDEFAKIRSSLGSPGASKRAAGVIIKMLS